VLVVLLKIASNFN